MQRLVSSDDRKSGVQQEVHYVAQQDCQQGLEKIEEHLKLLTPQNWLAA